MAPKLGDLGLRTVVDFRTPGEILLGGTDRLPPGVTAVSLPVAGRELGAFSDLIGTGEYGLQEEVLGDGRAADFMVQTYRGFVTGPRQRDRFGMALRMIAEGSYGLPLLYHCTSGSHRSGWMTALLLTTAGVPRETAITPPDRMTWAIVSRTRNGMAFSDVLTSAETSRPRHIDATPSTAMPISSSASGALVSNAPWAGILLPASPIAARIRTCTTLMTPSTTSFAPRTIGISPMNSRYPRSAAMTRAYRRHRVLTWWSRPCRIGGRGVPAAIGPSAARLSVCGPVTYCAQTPDLANSPAQSRSGNCSNAWNTSAQPGWPK